MTLGDSKTDSNAWVTNVIPMLRQASGKQWLVSNGGISGSRVASIAPVIGTILAAMPDTDDSPVNVLCNWGANDMTFLPAQATFEADYLTILDAIHAKWPLAIVRLTKAWKRGYDASAATMAGWVANVVAARPAFAVLADDESVWLKDGDDGAAFTVDGIHYSAAGQAAKALQVKAVLGY